MLREGRQHPICIDTSCISSSHLYRPMDNILSHPIPIPSIPHLLPPSSPPRTNHHCRYTPPPPHTPAPTPALVLAVATISFFRLFALIPANHVLSDARVYQLHPSIVRICERRISFWPFEGRSFTSNASVFRFSFFVDPIGRGGLGGFRYEYESTIVSCRVV